MSSVHYKLILLVGVIIVLMKSQPILAKTNHEDYITTTIKRDVIMSTGNPAKATKENLLKYLKTISISDKTISGLFVYRTGAERNNGMETIHKITGVFPGVVSTRMPIYSAEAQKWQSFFDEVISNWNNGSLVHIQWLEEANPLSQMEIFKPTQNSSNDELKWKDLTENGSELNKAWKKQLDSLVPYLKQLQSAGVIPICSFLPKINDKDYLWRGRSGINGSLKLHQITHDYLKMHHGLNSLIWAWHLYALGDMTNLEDYWPGNNYVDVASIQMLDSIELSTEEYGKLLKVVGDKPISMECIASVPTIQLLSLQPRWTWFTAYDFALEISYYNSDSSLNETFQNNAVINRGQIDLFKIHK